MNAQSCVRKEVEAIYGRLSSAIDDRLLALVVALTGLVVASQYTAYCTVTFGIRALDFLRR